MPSVPPEEHTRRLSAARGLMRRHGCDALVVTDPVSYHYFSGHRAPSHLGRPSLLMLPLEGDPVLITMWVQQFFAQLDGRDFPSWIEDRRFYVEVPFAPPPTDWGLTEALREKGLAEATIGIELGQHTRLGIPVDDLARLRRDLPHARFVDSGPIVWSCRMIKSEWELGVIRRACVAGGRAWQRCIERLQVGITAREVARMVALAYADEGASPMFSGFARGARGLDDTFEPGDVLYLDGGCLFDGYYTDFTRRVVFGTPSARQREEHRIALELQGAMLDQIRPGVAVRELFAVANAEIERAGLAERSYSDHPAKRLGHGIGLEQGEPPSINGVDQTTLRAGMVLTVEPKFLSEDGLVNPDDQVVVTANGCEILSTVPTRDLHVAG